MNTEQFLEYYFNLRTFKNEEKNKLSSIQLVKIDIELDNLKTKLKSLNF